MPLPIAVPRCSWKRSIAALTSSRLSVGACTTAAVPANETTAILTFRGRSATNAFAASCAATRRFGWTSAARMLPETSIARTIVSCADGRVISAAGRDDANSSAARARKQQRRRHVAAPGAAAAERFLDEAEVGVAQVRLLAPRDQEDVERDDRPAAASIAHSIVGQRKVIQGVAAFIARAPRLRPASPAGRGEIERPRRRSSWRAGCAASSGRRSAAPRRRGRRRCRARGCRRRRRASASRSAVSRRSAAAAKRSRKPRLWVSTTICSPVSASRIVTRPMSGRSISSGVEQAHRGHLVALRELAERASPSPAR